MKKICYEEYLAKRILNVHKKMDGWFWSKYSALPYNGCFYGCEYCYCRDKKYDPISRLPQAHGLEDPFSQLIRIKKNAPELLRKELKNKTKEAIYIDSYQPIETKYRLVREMLRVCLDYGFPVFINEKSPLLINDLDLLKKINKASYAYVGWSIIFSKDDKAKKGFEPYAPTISSRFKSMKKLSDNNIMTGTVLMPILPFISDSEENIKMIVKKTRDNGGSFVMDGGLTLWGYCRTYFYKKLAMYDKLLVKKYKELYSDNKKMNEYFGKIHLIVKDYCKKYKLSNHIPRPIKHYPKKLWNNKRIAEQLYNKSRDVMMTQGMGYLQYAYLKAAWTIDETEQDVRELYEKKGRAGLMGLRNIGDKMSSEIIKLIKKEGFNY